jgi:tetratricopeptide (TPR) repeat protein
MKGWFVLVALPLLAACTPSPHQEAVQEDLAAKAYDAHQRGYEALAKQDYTGAEADFLDAQKFAPNDSLIELDLGVVEIDLEKWDAAQAALEQAEKLGVKDIPQNVTDARYEGLSVSQLATENLALLAKKKAWAEKQAKAAKPGSP